MKNILKIALFIAAVVAVQLLYGWPELIADMKGFAETHNNPFAFFAIMSTGCAIGLPLSFCTLYAGAAFGAFWGSVLSVGGICISSAIGYAIGRFAFPGDIVENFKRRFNISNPRNMFDLNFFVRAVPGIPYCMQNFLLGGMNSDLKVYMVLGVAIQGLFAVAMNVLGSSFSQGGYLKYIAIAVIIMLVLLIRILFKRLFKIK